MQRFLKYNLEINSIETNIESIKNKYPKKSFVNDISADEKILLKYFNDCNNFRTNIKTIEYLKKQIRLQLMDLYNFEDETCVNRFLKKEVLSLIKKVEYSKEIIKSKFLPYKDMIDITEDNIDRPCVVL